MVVEESSPVNLGRLNGRSASRVVFFRGLRRDAGGLLPPRVGGRALRPGGSAFIPAAGGLFPTTDGAGPRFGGASATEVQLHFLLPPAAPSQGSLAAALRRCLALAALHRSLAATPDRATAAIRFARRAAIATLRGAAGGVACCLASVIHSQRPFPPDSNSALAGQQSLEPR